MGQLDSDLLEVAAENVEPCLFTLRDASRVGTVGRPLAREAMKLAACYDSRLRQPPSVALTNDEQETLTCLLQMIAEIRLICGGGPCPE